LLSTGGGSTLINVDAPRDGRSAGAGVTTGLTSRPLLGNVVAATVSPAVGRPVWSSVVASDADEPVVVLVCRPPELLTSALPVRRSRLGVSSVDAPFDDGLSDDVEREFSDDLDDDSSDDEPLSESPGAADATAGALATANPTPSAIARAHIPPRCFAFSMVFPSLTRAASTGRWCSKSLP
jgi:hypothetical protein